MSIDLPPELDWVAELAVGQSWPKGDEDRMQLLAQGWYQSAQHLVKLTDEIDPATTGVLGSLGGPVADQFADFTRQMRSVLPNVAESAQGVGDLSRNAAVQLEYTKYSLLIQFVFLAYVLWELASVGLPELDSLVIASVRAVCWRILQALARNVVMGTAFMVGTDVAVQAIQFLKGDRTSWSWGNTLQAAEGGAIGGAFAGIFTEAAKFVPPKFGNALGRQLAVGGATGIATTFTMDAINGDFGDALTNGLAATSGAIGGLYGGRKSGSPHNEPHLADTDFKLPDLPDFAVPDLGSLDSGGGVWAHEVPLDPGQVGNGAWVRRQWERQDPPPAYGERPEESPGAAVRRAWAQERSDLPVGVRASAIAAVAADGRVFGAGEEGRTVVDPVEVRRQLDRQAAVEQVVSRAGERFDAVYTAWADSFAGAGSSGDGRIEGGGGEKKVMTPEEGVAPRGHVLRVPGAAARVHEVAWRAVEREVRASVERLPASVLEGAPGRVAAVADRVFAQGEPRVHALLDRAVADDVRRVAAVGAFDRVVPRGVRGGHVLGAEGVLSQAGVRQLRGEFLARVFADHREVFGDLTTNGRMPLESSGPVQVGQVGRDAGATADAVTDGDRTAVASEQVWQERVAARLDALSGRVEVQLAKEAAARNAVDAVREAAKGSWRQALPTLGNGFAEAFGLDRRGADSRTEQAAALALARDAHTRIDTWAAQLPTAQGLVREAAGPEGGAALPTARHVAEEATAPAAARHHTALAVARATALDDAAHEARTLARQQPGSTPETVERAVQEHTDRVGGLFDRLFPARELTPQADPHGADDGRAASPGKAPGTLDDAVAAWAAERPRLTARLDARPTKPDTAAATAGAPTAAGKASGDARVETAGDPAKERAEALRSMRREADAEAYPPGRSQTAVAAAGAHLGELPPHAATHPDRGLRADHGEQSPLGAARLSQRTATTGTAGPGTPRVPEPRAVQPELRVPQTPTHVREEAGSSDAPLSAAGQGSSFGLPAGPGPGRGPLTGRPSDSPAPVPHSEGITVSGSPSGLDLRPADVRRAAPLGNLDGWRLRVTRLPGAEGTATARSATERVPWWTANPLARPPYVVAVTAASTGFRVQSNDRRVVMRPHEVADFLAADPALGRLVRDVPIVLLADHGGSGGLELPRLVAARTGRPVWSFSGDLRPTTDSRTRRTVMETVLPGDRSRPAGRWILSRPDDLGATTPAERASVRPELGVVATFREGTHMDELFVSQTLTDSNHESLGRAFLNDRDLAMRERAFARLGTLTSYQQADVDEHGRLNPRAGTERPLPWIADAPGTRPYFLVAHGYQHYVELPRSRDRGQPSRVDARELGHLLNRRPSLRLRPPEAPIVLVSCRTGGEYRVPEWQMAQRLADTTGRTVYAPSNDVSIHLNIRTGPRGDEGTWLVFQPGGRGAAQSSHPADAGPAGRPQAPRRTAAATGSARRPLGDPASAALSAASAESDAGSMYVRRTRSVPVESTSLHGSVREAAAEVHAASGRTGGTVTAQLVYHPGVDPSFLSSGTERPEMSVPARAHALIKARVERGPGPRVDWREPRAMTAQELQEHSTWDPDMRLVIGYDVLNPYHVLDIRGDDPSGVREPVDDLDDADADAGTATGAEAAEDRPNILDGPRYHEPEDLLPQDPPAHDTYAPPVRNPRREGLNPERFRELLSASTENFAADLAAEPREGGARQPEDSGAGQAERPPVERPVEGGPVRTRPGVPQGSVGVRRGPVVPRRFGPRSAAARTATNSTAGTRSSAGSMGSVVSRFSEQDRQGTTDSATTVSSTLSSLSSADTEGSRKPSAAPEQRPEQVAPEQLPQERGAEAANEDGTKRGTGTVAATAAERRNGAVTEAGTERDAVAARQFAGPRPKPRTGRDRSDTSTGSGPGSLPGSRSGTGDRPIGPRDQAPRRQTAPRPRPVAKEPVVEPRTVERAPAKEPAVVERSASGAPVVRDELADREPVVEPRRVERPPAKEPAAVERSASGAPAVRAELPDADAPMTAEQAAARRADKAPDTPFARARADVARVMAERDVADPATREARTDEIARELAAHPAYSGPEEPWQSPYWRGESAVADGRLRQLPDEERAFLTLRAADVVADAVGADRPAPGTLPAAAHHPQAAVEAMVRLVADELHTHDEDTARTTADDLARYFRVPRRDEHTPRPGTDPVPPEGPHSTIVQAGGILQQHVHFPPVIGTARAAETARARQNAAHLAVARALHTEGPDAAHETAQAIAEETRPALEAGDNPAPVRTHQAYGGAVGVEAEDVRRVSFPEGHDQEVEAGATIMTAASRGLKMVLDTTTYTQGDRDGLYYGSVAEARRAGNPDPQQIRSWIVEIVTDPLRVLPDEQRGDPDDVFGAFHDIQWRLGQVRDAVPLRHLFPESDGFAFTELGRHAVLMPSLDPNRPINLHVHITVGVPVTGLRELLGWAHGSVWRVMAAQILGDGLDFGDETAARLFGREPRTAGTLQGRPDFESARGYLALLYTHVAARVLNHTVTDRALVKHLLAVASRTPLQAIRAELPRTVRNKLNDNHARIVSTVKAYFAHRYPDHRAQVAARYGMDPSEIDTLVDPDAQGNTSYDVLDAALLNDPPKQLDARSAGMKNDYPELDTDQGRLRVPLVLLELRAHGSRKASTEEMIQRFGDAAGVSRRLYEQAVAAKERGRPVSSAPMSGLPREEPRAAGPSRASRSSVPARPATPDFATPGRSSGSGSASGRRAAVPPQDRYVPTTAPLPVPPVQTQPPHTQPPYAPRPQPHVQQPFPYAPPVAAHPVPPPAPHTQPVPREVQAQADGVLRQYVRFPAVTGNDPAASAARAWQVQARYAVARALLTGGPQAAHATALDVAQRTTAPRGGGQSHGGYGGADHGDHTDRGEHAAPAPPPSALVRETVGFELERMRWDGGTVHDGLVRAVLESLGPQWRGRPDHAVGTEIAARIAAVGAPVARPHTGMPDRFAVRKAANEALNARGLPPIDDTEVRSVLIALPPDQWTRPAADLGRVVADHLADGVFDDTSDDASATSDDVSDVLADVVSVHMSDLPDDEVAPAPVPVHTRGTVDALEPPPVAGPSKPAQVPAETGAQAVMDAEQFAAEPEPASLAEWARSHALPTGWVRWAFSQASGLVGRALGHRPVIGHEPAEVAYRDALRRITAAVTTARSEPLAAGDKGKGRTFLKAPTPERDAQLVQRLGEVAAAFHELDRARIEAAVHPDALHTQWADETTVRVDEAESRARELMPDLDTADIRTLHDFQMEQHRRIGDYPPPPIPVGTRDRTLEQAEPRDQAGA